MNPLLLSLFGAMLAFYIGLVIFARSTTRRVERLVPPQGTFLTLDGERVHYVERGSGPVTILLIHGLGGNARHFTYRVLDALSAEYRVIALDRPGSGYSTRASGADASPAGQAEVVAAFIRALELDRPVLVGHSLGGAVSLATAVAHPTLVRGLALVSPLTQLPPAVPEVFASLVIPSAFMRRVIAWTFAVPLSISRRDVVLSTVFGPEAVPRDFGVAGGGLLGVRPSAFIASSTDLVAAPPTLPALVQRYTELTLPIGVLYGTHDRVLSPRLHGEGLRAQLPQVQLELVDGAGHMLPLTVPDRVTAFIRGVVARTD
jgi:pimeloyl-ACP methyl ester carboxylesterase